MEELKETDNSKGNVLIYSIIYAYTAKWIRLVFLPFFFFSYLLYNTNVQIFIVGVFFNASFYYYYYFLMCCNETTRHLTGE